MTESIAIPRSRQLLPTWLLMVLAGALSIFLGAVIGNPNPLLTTIFCALIGLSVWTWIAKRPFHGFLILAGTVFFLICYAVTDDQYLNFFDFVLPVVGLATWFGQERKRAHAEDALLTGPAQDEIRKLVRRFERAGIAYFSLIAVSLVYVFFRIGSKEALTNFLFVCRVVEGALMFPLSMWWLRSEKRILAAIDAAIVAGAVCATVNIYQVFVMHTFRAGLTWVFNHLDWPIENANATGYTMLLLWALILARHHYRPRWWSFPALGLTLFIMFLSQSRSGLLSLIIFTLLSLRRIRWQYLLAALVLVPVALKFVPKDFFERMARSIAFQKGTFEVYSMMIRVYGDQSGFRAFLANPIFGVGFMGLPFLSQNFNDLGITELGSENIFLSTAADMGVIGLAVLVSWFVVTALLGWRLLKLAPRNTLAHALAGVFLPYFIAMTFINQTGTTFYGVNSLGQFTLMVAMTVRASQLALSGAVPAANAPDAPDAQPPDPGGR